MCNNTSLEAAQLFLSKGVDNFCLYALVTFNEGQESWDWHQSVEFN